MFRCETVTLLYEPHPAGLPTSLRREPRATKLALPEPSNSPLRPASAVSPRIHTGSAKTTTCNDQLTKGTIVQLNHSRDGKKDCPQSKYVSVEGISEGIFLFSRVPLWTAPPRWWRTPLLLDTIFSQSSFGTTVSCSTSFNCAMHLPRSASYSHR